MSYLGILRHTRNLIAVHPDADQAFMDTVVRTVSDYAPKLREHVLWSKMREPPPLFGK